MSGLQVTDASEGLTTKLEEEWDGLADRSGAPPFVRPGWVAAWWRSFGRGSLEIAQLRRGRDLAAVIPLERRVRRLASPTNAHTPLFAAVSADEEAAVELLGAVVRRPVTQVSLEYLDPGANGLATVSTAASTSNARIATFPLARSPYVDTSCGLERYRDGLSAKLLREIRRRRRRLEDRGAVTLAVEDGAVGLERLLQKGLELEAAAWKRATGTSIDSRGDTAAFYRDVADWAAKRGTLRLGFLKVDERPIAFDFALEEGGVHYLLKTGFDPDARDLGPGIMMRWEMIARAFSRGLTSYEFLGQDEEWKLRWTAATRERLRSDVFPPSPAGRMSRAWRTALRPLVARTLRRIR